NVLVVGSGGREHALSWQLGKSSDVDTVYTAPGNGGTKNNVDIGVNQLEELADFASQNNCFTVVGPEAPLAAGIVDLFVKRNLPIFGPTKKAAQLESSKIWAKEFLKRNSILTADFETFGDAEKAKSHVDSVSYNVVIKADGLAAGKGVMVCNSKDEAKAAIDIMLVKKTFGEAGSRIIIEERIDGIEASYIALCDGNTALSMASSQDHKRIYDDDRGPNTGGMGAYSPTPIITKEIEAEIQNQIIDKTIQSMKDEGIAFTGFLYAGLMIKDDKPYVLEFNVRMGDPECQPIATRMDFDLFKYLFAAANGKLSELEEPRWKSQSAVCVVLASKGYPEAYPKGEEISGLENIPQDTMVFHAGTKREDGKVLTSGGRVLGVTSTGKDLKDAISRSYQVVDMINWDHKYYRTDIGKKGLSYP
ncbi:MAG: phosphoribosylamine--glycine ligase, partial [Nitrosopumilaceae archaeon]|nr:phosphoribosylamine--glycine ligase [Nitrosopumilaceae archaeon]NIU02127.1 phosphoribosylamine--glycine ligase [Nitrosopumilaceae archaeon]NIU88513.1 phosphoribosylamine--glycine ligase [Nitrosopumilaceae archaeon]NIV67160.1 phosphoribosylamine--glycine ligase [Nitrosopumilaceae archaeon]NIX62728.1 phosphoribosylamine--glycine ligase [Nitrosopumilaceae archaeon]